MRRIMLLGCLAATIVLPAAAAETTATVLLGQGVQIYKCAPAGAGAAWQLQAPDATLTDAAGHRVGHHFAGPSWQAEDGSLVTGEALVTSRAPRADAIPWLVLKAKSHSGEGLFSAVAFIVRSATVGGAAPDAGCDPAHEGTEARVDYSAPYTFFPG